MSNNPEQTNQLSRVTILSQSNEASIPHTFLTKSSSVAIVSPKSSMEGAVLKSLLAAGNSKAAAALRPAAANSNICSKSLAGKDFSLLKQ